MSPEPPVGDDEPANDPRDARDPSGPGDQRPRPAGSGEPASPRRASSRSGTSIGLDANVAGLGAYLLGWISGLILLLVEKEHREVRFHAAQSLIVSVALIAVFIAFGILTMIPVLGLVFVLVQVLLGLASFGLWIYLLVQGYKLNHVKLPVVGDYAEQLAAKQFG